MKKIIFILLLMSPAFPSFGQSKFDIGRHSSDAVEAQSNLHATMHPGMYTNGKSSEWEYEYNNDTSAFLLSKKGKGIYMGRVKASGEKYFRNGYGIVKENNGKYIFCKWKRDFEDGKTIVKMPDASFKTADYKIGKELVGTRRDTDDADIDLIESEITKLEAILPYIFK